MRKRGKQGRPIWDLVRVWKALQYSLAGLNHAARYEPAFRQEIVLTCVMIPLACVIPVSTLLKLFLITAHLIVLIVELLNTAIECVVDKVCPEYDPLVKQAKDMGSAAVLLSLVILALVWAVALYRLPVFR